MSVPYTKTATSLTVVVNFRPTVIPSSHPNFAKLADLVADPATTEAQIVPLLDIPAAIVNFTGNEIKVIDGRLFYRGVEVKDNLAKLIIGFVKAGDHGAALPFQKFLANCRNNPDPELVSTIYDWSVKGNLPITPDGELLAWKIVQNDYYSKHSGKRGKLRHMVGDVVSEPREECDPNRNQTCSRGIHFASLEYIEKGSYGGSEGSGDRIMAVVVNPSDITAIPTDYNLSKGRCCRLKVVGEVPRSKVPSFYDNSGRVYGGWSAPARNTFEVGDVWKQRNGKAVTITSVTQPDTYSICADTGAVFTAKGRWNSDTTTSPLDLIWRIR
jgi:hypothetical protein